MSIKKLFEAKNKQFVSSSTEKELFSEVESSRNMQALHKKQQAVVPQVVYNKPDNFVRYGSAYLYYKSSIDRILDYYPYDGSSAEINEFYNNSLEIDKYIFNNQYPRTNGYAIFSPDGYGTTTSITDGYALSDTLEYVVFHGGPHTASSGPTLKDAFPSDGTLKPQHSNVYDTDIYATEGLPDTYGVGTRTSNLKANFDTGVTVEFWLKSGSLAPAGSTTYKQVIFDAWNNASSASVDYGRITIQMTGSGIWSDSPFYLTVMSGAVPSAANPRPERSFVNTSGKGIHLAQVGSGLVADGNWHHYAFALYNSGSNFNCSFYVDGKLNKIETFASAQINELNPKGMVARLGALTTAPAYSNAATGSAKLSGSIDEFRFWKERRTSDSISKNWHTNVYGGANTEINNATLGVYYKFNEGKTLSSSIDSIVLDYSGRVSNGSWVGYVENSRNTNSAIVEAGAASTEYKDPIIYENHPDVSSVKTELLAKGKHYDSTNNSAFASMLPHWIHEEERDNKETDTKIVSHIVGSYFDKLYLQIKSVTNLKRKHYTSASYTPIPFAKNLPRSLGMRMPEIFVDADVLESFANRDGEINFEGDLQETKNLIYLNLYNNLANIYKAKGTERAVRNVFRCFSVDERIIRLNLYSNNQKYELKNNLKQFLRNKKSINFDNENNLYGVIYTATSGSDSNSANYIYGSAHGATSGYENKYGFTVDADITFPAFTFRQQKYNKQYTSASLFGVVSASINSDVGTTWASTDSANFQVYAIRPRPDSKDVYFRLTSSINPYPFPELTSSVFFNVYDNERWNLSVRLKPSNWPVADLVSGSGLYTYDLEFRGVNTYLGEAQESFLLTASISQALGKNMLKSAKRLYAGAFRTNVTGAKQTRCDVKLSGIRYWGRYIEDYDLDQHIVDVDNSGISGSYQNISPADPNNQKYDLLNNKMLFLDWKFENVTGSNATGRFYVQDMSSGSVVERTKYGTLGNYSEYQHTGYGFGFASGSGDVVINESLSSYKFLDPESPLASERVQVLSEDDNSFGVKQDVPSYFYTIEKSLYNSVSEEMLDFFAGAADFNNLIGEPVNRYRERYKRLEKLREVFFQRVTKVSDVEKYVTYYKWFDSAISAIIQQLMPASCEFVNNVLNTVESHVLERNKYQTKFPTIEFTANDPDYPILGINEKNYNWRLAHHPLNNKQNTNFLWWNERWERDSLVFTGSTPGTSTADDDKETIRKSIVNDSNASASLLTTTAKAGYYSSTYMLRKRAKPYKLNPITTRAYKGGVNFKDNKNIHFTYNALYPAGPVNKTVTDSGTSNVFVPENVLLAFTDELSKSIDVSADVTDPNKKVRRYYKVQHGRDWGNGDSYSNVKSSYAFPFNIFSSSIDSGSLSSGYNKRVQERVTASITITNLHNDVYGPDMEVPMQGAFTNYAVGGHQSRHIAINTGSLDDYTNRAEAWKIVLGTCTAVPEGPAASGAIGMVGADYPWPEANDEGVIPYPVTASQKAVYYRDHVAKRPVNIRNIHHKTGSTILGNYSHNYEVVHTVGGYSNPRGFVDNQPELPSQIIDTPSASQGRTIYDIHRNTDNRVLVSTGIQTSSQGDRHFQLIPSYSLGYLRSPRSTNKSVIIGRFSAPGGIETMGLGYCDIRAAEYSVYNTINYRNLTVRKLSQGPSGSYSESSSFAAGTPGIKVSDIHDKDYGLRSHLSRHTARFGRDSLHVYTPGASYTELPGYHKVHRNSALKLILGSSGEAVTSSQYDNYWVNRPIPRNDRQYAWVTRSIAAGSTDIRYYGYARTDGVFSGRYSGSDGYEAFFNYVTASDVAKPADRTTATSNNFLQPITRLNLFVVDPVNDVGETSLSNSSGRDLNTEMSNYINDPLVKRVGVVSGTLDQFDTRADTFNLLMAHRGASYGWSWTRTRQQDHPILKAQRKQNVFSVLDNKQIKNYTFRPASTRGVPVSVNVTIDTSTAEVTGTSENVTLVTTHNNNDIYFNSVELDNLLFSTPPQKVSSFETVLNVAEFNPGYAVNWILYKETLFPSMENEHTSSTYTRPAYDNKYWRDSTTERINLGSTSVITNSCGVTVRQSSWILDAPAGFLTRSSEPYIPGSNVLDLKNHAQAGGELQNVYFQVVNLNPAIYSASSNRPVHMTELQAPGALYARKHCLPSPKSVVGPNGIDIPQTGGLSSPYNHKIDKFGGEANWDALSNAGYLKTVTGSTTFVSAAAAPWWNTYNDYKRDLSMIGKDYSVIPEFRISKHVEGFIKEGVNTYQVSDIFEIGDLTSATTGSLLLDYSNTEFMTNFVGIKDLSKINPSQIKLSCNAIIRPDFKKGFFPAQRTVDLVQQFSSSYSSMISAVVAGTATSSYSDKPFGRPDGSWRPTMQPLFAPGILYNSIKSGIAVDFPIPPDPGRISSGSFGTGSDNNPNWMVTNNWQVGGAANTDDRLALYKGGSWFRRLPFETILNPEKYIAGMSFYDIEPDPSCSLPITGVFSGQPTDQIYKMMASNFIAEVPKFFLKNAGMTELKSDVIPGDLRFKKGEAYLGRITLAQSYEGLRTYTYESGASGDNSAYSAEGANGMKSNKWLTGSVYPIPQDPRQAPKDVFRKNHCMYSRPSAFGPPIAGRPTGAMGHNDAKIFYSQPFDSMNGHNVPYTPPYYDGEAWLDVSFFPTPGESYDLERILSELQVAHWRIDAGPSASVLPNTAPGAPHVGLRGPQLVACFSGNLGIANRAHEGGDLILDGKNINDNAMQLTASFNILGVERVLKQTKSRGLSTTSENETAGMRWVIQPKWETPILDFSDRGVRPITASNGTIQMPTFASASVPRGMWHQFGLPPDDPKKGIFLNIGEIPREWLLLHPQSRLAASIYNNFTSSNATKIAKTYKPITDLIKFSEADSVRLGELANYQSIREAVVAIPYLEEGISEGEEVSGEAASDRKSFFSITREKINACVEGSIGTADGDSLDSAGESIRKMVQKMQKYILPPQFDFLNDATIDPVVMYLFEFEYKFDNHDLNYMWQNLAPRDYKKITKDTQSQADQLDITERMNMDDLMNENLRWMVFKVKQRSQAVYNDIKASEAGSTSSELTPSASVGYPIRYNWPYDFFSFVELIKFDAEVLYKNEQEQQEE
tara:strand:- start:4633 stop:13953 length:9321 start_codon:yes stop_codon:yes gene_type:complete